MVCFIYTDGNSLTKTDVDMDLLAIAHKYELNALETVCEQNLCSELHIENVLEMYWKWIEIVLRMYWECIENVLRMY